MKKKRIGVIGAGEPSQEIYRIAEEAGKEIASRGAVLICGGLGGVMEAACKGAKSNKGETIGILPGKAIDDANPYVDIPIATGLADARNVIIIHSCDGIIAVGGASGTLSEIAYALKWRIPLVGIKTWELKSQGQEEKAIMRASGAKEAVDKLFSSLGE
jgi:uncharacterized protein (TIGR00725 family)